MIYIKRNILYKFSGFRDRLDICSDLSFFFSYSSVRFWSRDPHDGHRRHGPRNPSNSSGEQRGDRHGEFCFAHRRETAEQAEAGGAE